MQATARFVNFGRADEDDRVVVARGLAVNQSLGAAGWLAADDADRMEFGHFFRPAHEFRHGAKRFAAKIRVQPGDDDANASVGQLVGDIDDGRVEELRFINRDNRCFRLQTVEDRSGVGQRLTFDILAVVAGDKLDAITVVDIGLEDLNALSGDDGAAHAADQLFRLAAKHAAANHLDLAYMVNHGGDLNFSRAEKTDGANVTRSA